MYNAEERSVQLNRQPGLARDDIKILIVVAPESHVGLHVLSNIEVHPEPSKLCCASLGEVKIFVLDLDLVFLVKAIIDACLCKRPNDCVTINPCGK
jgi:hypothetical protein